MKSKKGALQLSMSTIVIIVIGVTLLILGLGFITGLFEKASEQRDIIFGDLETKITGLGSHDERLNVQTQVTVEQGDQTLFKVYIVNFEEAEKTFKLTLSPSTDPEFQNDDVIVKLQRESMKIPEGQEASFAIGVRAKDGAKLRAAAYNIDVTSDGQQYAADSFLVEVKK